MTEALDQLGRNHLAGFVLVLARVGPLFVLAPLFSARMVPPRARAVIAVALALGLAPLALGGRAVPGDALELAMLALKEIMVGTAFAFSLAVVFAALTSAGAILDTSIGFNFGSLVDPVADVQSGPMAQLYSLVGVAVFVAIGGDAWVVQGLAHTYDAVPLLATPSLTSLTAGAVDAFAGIFGGALEVAAPVLLALVLTDVAFGVVSRVVPQLNAFAVGFPLKTVVGILVLGVSLPFAANWISDQLQLSVESALRSLQVG